MAQYVTFTDTDGNVFEANPDDIGAIYPYPLDNTKTVLDFNNGKIFISALSVAAAKALFSVNGEIDLGIDTIDHLTGIISIGNSILDIPLAGGATFLGPYEDVSRYSYITYAINGAPALAGGTLSFEFSFDQAQVDISVPLTVLNVDEHPPHTLVPIAQYFRLRYVNGITPLTNFRLQTTFHNSKSKGLSRFAVQPFTDYDDVELSRSIIVAKNPAGDYENIEATDTDPLPDDTGLIVRTVSSNNVNVNNSSTTPLGIGATFTGAFEDMAALGIESISIIVRTDQIGTLFIDNSTDGVNLDRTFTFTIPSTVNGNTYGFAPRARFHRIRFTNTSGVGQTFFRLQTIYNKEVGGFTFIPAVQPQSDDSNVLSTKAIISGKRESDGAYTNVALSPASSLKVALADRPSEVRNRIHVDANVENITAFPTTVYTVTAGKIFYLQSIGISYVNTSLTVNTRIVVRDNATVKLPYIGGQASAQIPAVATSSPTTFAEPIPFTTNVNVNSLGGTNSVSLYIIGYEE